MRALLAAAAAAFFLTALPAMAGNPIVPGWVR